MDPSTILPANSLLYDRTRLAIMTTLAKEDEPIAFVELLTRLNLTKGNLSVHTRKLEEAGLLSVDKRFMNRKPVTSFRCTDKGHNEIKEYLNIIEQVLRESVHRN